MAETKFKFKKCELIPNEGSSLDEKYELLGGGPIDDYYESIDSPTADSYTHLTQPTTPYE